MCRVWSKWEAEMCLFGCVCVFLSVIAGTPNFDGMWIEEAACEYEVRFKSKLKMQPVACGMLYVVCE